MHGRTVSDTPQNSRESASARSMVYNAKCSVCRRELDPYPLGQPPDNLLEVNVAPARTILYDHGLNRRVHVCATCAGPILNLLGIHDFDWGDR